MITYQEMISLCDKYQQEGYGRTWVDVHKIKEELFWQWGFDHMQVTRIIFDMRDRGLIPPYGHVRLDEDS